ncbi:MAG: ABC transporter substrate-binding protein [Chloroflexi bacterium]|nr:ABC transporter substrate-binding protein [Chloroflexota bacterium]
MVAKLGKYEIINMLGEGATSEVYHARDTVLGRDVTLKVLKPALVPDPSAFSRFMQEARAAARLFHHHIATVLDMNNADGRYFIAMRYIPGISLDKILKENGPLSWEETLRLTSQIGGALDYAHGEGFLHRDVKPSNIIQDEKGDFWLTDFGLTRAMMSTGLTSHTGAVLGTPSYVAPEIWQGEPAVPATDQYALACVVYEALTGGILFSGETPPAIMTAHVLKGVKFSHQWPVDAPEGVGVVLERALAKDANSRYRDFTSLMHDLEKLNAPSSFLEPVRTVVDDIKIKPKNQKDIHHEVTQPPAQDVRTEVPVMRTSPSHSRKISPSPIRPRPKKSGISLPQWIWIFIFGLFVLGILISIGSAVGSYIMNNKKFDCTDPIGCVSYEPGEPIRLASALVISGPVSDLGVDSLYGVEIAIDYYGEVLGHAVELQSEDDGCSAEGGQAAGQKIVSNPSIIAVIGTSCSGAGVPMSEVISEAGYVMVSPSNTAPSLTDPDQVWMPGYLRTSHNDKVQGKAMAEFAYNALGVRTAATIHDGDPYTEGLARVFADAFEALGGSIIEFTAVNKGDTDMRPMLTMIAAAGPPEFLYFPVFPAEGGFLTKQTQEVSGLQKTILAAADGMISSAAIEAVGKAGEGMYFSGPDLTYSGTLYNQFLETYQEKYGSKPLSVFHAHAFDATNLILSCIEEVAIQDDGTLHIGRQAMRGCLYGKSGYEGITGTLTCNSYGDCADPKIAVSQLQNGQYVRVWP